MIKQYFLFPFALAALVLLAVFLLDGPEAFVLAAILVVLEVTLSFDNAVVNAKVLSQMTPRWQKRFLTWGILLAVFGTRLLLPILIVSVAVWASPLSITLLALKDSVQYGELLTHVRPTISAFGGSFLLMVALKYFFNETKDVHWIRVIERRMAHWGRIEAIEIAVALISLLALSFAAPLWRADILVAGIFGIVLFVLMEGITSSLSSSAKNLTQGGLSLFLYLNVLDSAFSLDGVVGAFALTVDLLVIVAGLGIGAYFVRSMTLYLVRAKTLESLVYLEHGAHWAIFGLALSMFAGLVIHVPEVVTGFIGLFFVVWAYVSSRAYSRLTRA